MAGRVETCRGRSVHRVLLPERKDDHDEIVVIVTPHDGKHDVQIIAPADCKIVGNGKERED